MKISAKSIYFKDVAIPLITSNITSYLRVKKVHRMQENQETKNVTPRDGENTHQEKSRGGLGFIGKKTMPTESKKTETPPESKPKKPLTFLQSHPLLPISTVTPCLSTTLFNSMAFVPWLFLAVILIAQTIFTLDTRGLWFPNEVHDAAIFDSLLKSNHWFTLTTNQGVYAAHTHPLYFAFMRGVHFLLQQEGNILFFLTSIASGLVYLWSALIMGRFVGRMDGRSLLAGGSILLSSGFLIGTLHHVGMELLFSAFILLSFSAFFVALAKPRSYVFMILSFLCAGIAYLTGGALGLALPLLVSLLFVLWCKKIHRFFQLDTLIGCIVFLAVIGAWGFGIFTETKSFDFLLSEVLQKQTIQKVLTAFSLQNAGALYFFWLPCIFLPWIPLIFCLPWHKLFSKNTWQGIIASQKPEKEGLAFLWCIVIVSTLLLPVLADKSIFYYLPAFTAISLLAGRAVLALSTRRAAFFRVLLVLLFLVLTVCTVALAFFLFDIFEVPHWLLSSMPQWKLPISSSFYLIATLFLVIAFALWLIPRKTSVEGILLIITIGALAISFSSFKVAAPNFDTVLSPKTQGTLIQSYVTQGYYSASLDIPEGMYTYYSQASFHQLSSQGMVNELIQNQKHTIVAMSASVYDDWQDKPDCLEEVHKQWIGDKQYVLLACPRNASIEKMAQKLLIQQKSVGSTSLEEETLVEEPKVKDIQPEELSEPDTTEANQQ